jgi:hypothetical protein
MKKIFSRNKSIALLLFLFGYNNLFALGGTDGGCRLEERIRRDILSERQLDICEQRSVPVNERASKKHAFLYLKMPQLSDEYLEYNNGDLKYTFETDKRKERSIPVRIEFDYMLLNPRKEDWQLYTVSSRIKEQIISENALIKRRSCLFMALGSEYLLPIPAKQGTLSVIIYFDYTTDVAQYKAFRELIHYRVPENYFDQFIHRSLYTEVNFKKGKIYQLELAINPNSALPRGSYNATTLNTFETMNTVPGFTITLKELPPNTKFAFDGKDDVGKTYEQVKKEFILYDKSAEEN